MKLLFALCLICFTIFSAGAETLRVIYIHGWNPSGEIFDQELKLLQNIFPAAQVTAYSWDASSKNFGVSCRIADAEAGKLAGHLAKLPNETLGNTILVGHSLGGRITVKCMALLGDQGKKIRQGIFLGAAIPDDDPHIARAIKASILPNINIYNRMDYILRHVYMAYNLSVNQKKSAFGAFGYAYGCSTGQLRQFNMGKESHAANAIEYVNRIRNHSSFEYLISLRDHFSLLTADYPERRDYSTAANMVKVSDNDIRGKLPPLPDELSLLAGSRILDSKKNWRFLHFKTYITKEYTVRGKKVKSRIPVNVYYIVDERDFVVYAHMFYLKTKSEFERIKAQL